MKKKQHVHLVQNVRAQTSSRGQAGPGTQGYTNQVGARVPQTFSFSEVRLSRAAAAQTHKQCHYFFCPPVICPAKGE